MGESVTMAAGLAEPIEAPATGRFPIDGVAQPAPLPVPPALADLLEARRRELQLGGPVAFSAVPEPAPLSAVAPPSAMPSNAIPSDAVPRDFARKVENQLAFLQ